MSTEEYERYRADAVDAYLSRIRTMRIRCEALRAEIDEARETAQGVRGIDYSDAAPHGSPSPDGIPNAVIRIQSRVGRYAEELAACVDETERAHRIIHSLEDGSDAALLSAYYIRGLDWYHAADAAHMSISNAMRRRRAALASLYGQLPPGMRDPMPPAI